MDGDQVFQLSLTFLERFTGGFATMDLPLRLEGAARPSHIDAYLHSEDLSVLLVCGRANSWANLMALAQRMNDMTPEVVEHFRNRHRDLSSARSATTARVAMASTWRLDTAEWWCGNAGSKPRWLREGFPCEGEGWTYRYRPVFTEHSGTAGTLYWLYAFAAMTA